MSLSLLFPPKTPFLSLERQQYRLMRRFTYATAPPLPFIVFQNVFSSFRVPLPSEGCEIPAVRPSILRPA